MEMTGFGLILTIILIVPFWKICERVGYSGWLSLLIAVPLVNIGLLYFLAFSQWPGAATANKGQQE